MLHARAGVEELRVVSHVELSFLLGQLRIGGEGGIRTPVTLPGKLDFESSAFNRARPPLRFSNVSFLLPQASEEVAKHRSGLLGQNAADDGQLMVQPSILT
jgi:hypothetical protein